MRNVGRHTNRHGHDSQGGMAKQRCGEHVGQGKARANGAEELLLTLTRWETNRG